jgi:Scavenger mRNA decapping enzyme C-term binding
MCATVLVVDTPSIYQGERMQAYIDEQRSRVDRKWVERVLAGEQETDSIRLQTDEVVLLPDTSREHRDAKTHKPRERCQWGPPRVGQARYAPPRGDRPEPQASVGRPEPQASVGRPEPQTSVGRPEPQTSVGLRGDHPEADVSSGSGSDTFGWVAFVRDASLRTIRDLRGHHVPMLRRIHEQCVQTAQLEHGGTEEEVMVFANYPPSVYTLHFHVCRPFKLALPFDAFRVHSLLAIIHHLEVDPGYYTRHNLHVPVSAASRLYRALTGPLGLLTLEL